MARFWKGSGAVSKARRSLWYGASGSLLAAFLGVIGLIALLTGGSQAGVTTVAPLSPLSTEVPARVDEAGAAPAAANAPAWIPGDVLPISGSVTLYLPTILRSPLLFFPMIGTSSPLVAPYPAISSTDRSPNTYLTWRLDLPDAGRYRYTVQLQPGTDDPTAVLATGINVPHFDPPTLAYGTRYSWRVTATSDAGERFVGPVWSFTTMPQITSVPDIESMVYVPEGEFRMGCDPSVSTIYPCLAREQPLHAVYLDSFWIDKYEVTNLQYRNCVRAGECNAPRKFNSFKRDNYFMNSAYDYYPVMYVSWWDAQDYCRWVDKRLPTEAEWEKAARGAIDTRTWPWGEEAPDCTRIDHLPDGTICTDVIDSQRVGSFPANISPYGALDMSGNVFEWVNDRYDVTYYQRSPYFNPPGPTGSDLIFFSIRGGGYRDNWYYMRVSHRHWGHHGDEPFTDVPYYRSERLGFRCAATAGFE